MFKFTINFSAFNHLLDDNPLPANEASSSVLVASYLHIPLQKGKGAIGGGNITTNNESEKGLLTLVCSDAPGIQVYFITRILLIVSMFNILMSF